MGGASFVHTVIVGNLARELRQVYDKVEGLKEPGASYR